MTAETVASVEKTTLESRTCENSMLLPEITSPLFFSGERRNSVHPIETENQHNNN
jgi:hypothetical protein